MDKSESWLKLWDKLSKELKPLDDNNAVARLLYNHVQRNFEPKDKKDWVLKTKVKH